MGSRVTACAMVIGAMAGAALPVGVTAQSVAGRAGPAPAHEFIGRWRVVTATIAPWVASDSAGVDRTRLLARVVQLGATSLTGLPPFDCTDGRFEPTQVEPEGLFQGGLPAPAGTAARALGFSAGRVRGIRLICASGVFEFHAADSSHLLVAIDNVILTLDRSPGAQAAETSPAGAVQALLERHASNRFAFHRAAVERLRTWLDARLIADITAYFDAPTSPDEAPLIDGDPFTDSQETPTRFAVQQGRITGRRAEVAVVFADGWSSKTLRYRLERDGAAWRIVDIVFGDGSTFTKLLRDGAAASRNQGAGERVWE